MVIANDHVVSIHYTVKLDDGTVVDTSEGKNPLLYLQGRGNIIPGLEKALEGRKQGDSFQVQIAPEDAYGVRHEQMVQTVPKTELPDEGGEVAVGVRFQVETPHGPIILEVTEVQDENVVLDGNHPLAGKTLHFDVEVDSIREATKEELEHGHVHGEGGHAH